MGVIVVGVDFEDGSRAAIQLAKAEAARTQAKVVLVHVYAIPAYAYPGLEPAAFPVFGEELANAAKSALEQVAYEHQLSGVVRSGDPCEEILAAAKELGAEMIVMGTHGRRGLSHFLLGSTTEKVIRKSPIPVLVVPVRTVREAA